MFFFRDAGREDCSCSEQDHPENSQFKKKVSLEEQKAQKEDRFLRRRPIAFMIYDYFRVTGAHDTVSDHADLFSVTLHDDKVQEVDTRWDEVLLCQRFHPMISWKVCMNSEYISLRYSKPYWHFTTW